MGGGWGEDGRFQEGEPDRVRVGVEGGGDVERLAVVVVVRVGGGEHCDVCGRLERLFQGCLDVVFRGLWLSSKGFGDFGDLIHLGDRVCGTSDEEHG